MPDGFKTFAVGETLRSADVNSYLMEQATAVFATEAARDAAIATPQAGQRAHTLDTATDWIHDGVDWVAARGGGSYQYSQYLSSPVTSSAFPGTALFPDFVVDPSDFSIGDALEIELTVRAANNSGGTPANGAVIFHNIANANENFGATSINHVAGDGSDSHTLARIQKVAASEFLLIGSGSISYSLTNSAERTSVGIGTLAGFSGAKTFRCSIYDTTTPTINASLRSLVMRKVFAPS